MHGIIFHGQQTGRSRKDACFGVLTRVLAGIFRRMFPFAKQYGIRLVAINRRDYAGSTPYSQFEHDRLMGVDEAAHRDALLQEGQELATFLEQLVKALGIPKVQTGSDGAKVDVAAVSFCVLLATLSDSPNVCGIVGMCKSGSIQSTQLVFLIAQNGYAQASVVLSLGTNVLATSLVAYKAWYVFFILHAFFKPDPHLAINETGYTDNC